MNVITRRELFILVVIFIHYIQKETTDQNLQPAVSAFKRELMLKPTFITKISFYSYIKR